MSGGYRLRLLLVALIGIVLGGWFLYDGFVMYPRDRAIAVAYEQFKADGRLEEWAAYATAPERNWPDGRDGPPGHLYSAWDIGLQRVLGIAVLPFGLLCLAAAGMTLGRWVRCDEQGLSTSWGVAAPFASLRKLDKSRWDRKGIAVVHYDKAGRTGRVVLDDWKYQRQPTEQILAAIERHLPASE